MEIQGIHVWNYQRIDKNRLIKFYNFFAVYEPLSPRLLHYICLFIDMLHGLLLNTDYRGNKMAWGLFTAASGTKHTYCCLSTYCWTNEPKKGISKHKVIKRCWAPNISTSTRLQEPGESTEPNSLQRETQRAPKSNAKSWINKTFKLNKWGLEQALSNVWDSRNVLFYGSLYSSLNYASAVSRSTTKGQDTEILSFVVWWIESEMFPNRLMFYFICIRFCLYTCLGTMRMAVPVDAREGYQIPWNQLSNGSVF